METDAQSEDYEVSNTEDFSYSELDSFPEFLNSRANNVLSLQLDHNNISVIPRNIALFKNLVSLDVSNNNLGYISKEIVHLSKLISLVARNNNLEDDAIPMEICMMPSLSVVNFAGNRLTSFPIQLTKLAKLKCLYLGSNRISSLPSEIGNLKQLEVLYLGRNCLASLPCAVGSLESLISLVLSDNRLESLPSTLILLQKLQSLSLHGNRLSTLPPAIVGLRNLEELSLRNNPLVVKFVQDMLYEPPSLKELSARVIKIKKIPYTLEDVPKNLYSYLNEARRCVNPKCKGVYFSARVEQVKFVDFCGKYRLPLLEYLCSPNCSVSPAVLASSSSSSETDSEDELAPPVAFKLQKVLLPQGVAEGES